MGLARGLRASIIGGVMIAASSLGVPTPAFAVSAFCASSGQTIILNQGDFTTINFALEQGEKLTFAISQTNGNPANPQVLRITNLLTPSSIKPSRNLQP